MAARRPRILRALLSRSTLLKIVLLFLIWSIVEAHISYYHIARAERESRARTTVAKPTRIFIASLHWNNEEVLRSDWNKGVVDLARSLGPENVFVSVYESGSWDNSTGALRELDRELEKMGVGTKIVLDEETHQDLIAKPPQEEGWIDAPAYGRKMPRRIPYLSRLRNISLQPLRELAMNGTMFDHVLFLGDVVFSVPDILALLDTNNGHYGAACSLDFSKPPYFYDTFALRDIQGHEHATLTWPYFRASQSRKAMVHAWPVPVSSCWNGIVAMPASTFTGIRGLEFRGLADSLAVAHLEASECCLVHADNPASRTRGVFVNPAVRVGYSRAAYDAVHAAAAERGGSWLTLGEVFFGIWRNRIARWLTTPCLEESEVRRKIKRWEGAGEGRREKGGFCAVDEMQIVVHNGWKHL
ncbi:glycosyltransferase family 69 protein [Parathielavia hyrcaniae]|uniref:Glycosyltransferase family 69 protein n=1 Tax=Parathielavia hyrcaniae TaxID=113614 RepID=A0AAN6Q109_9PEZI|nr:glycosyltransferase family 69 protein [Parathielavia hyrcaniae]